MGKNKNINHRSIHFHLKCHRNLRNINSYIKKHVQILILQSYHWVWNVQGNDPLHMHMHLNHILLNSCSVFLTKTHPYSHNQSYFLYLSRLCLEYLLNWSPLILWLIWFKLGCNLISSKYIYNVNQIHLFEMPPLTTSIICLSIHL